MLLEEIEIPKGNIQYFFIGGMNYSRDFGFQESYNRFPFTTYYMDRIEDMVHEDITYRSLFYCKLPLICLQFGGECECIEFEVPARCGDKKVYPFVGLAETNSTYRIIFRHFPEFTLKQKDKAWLGIGKKRRLRECSGEIEFKVKRYTTQNWIEAVRRFLTKELRNNGSNFGNFNFNSHDPDIRNPELCRRSKEALRRSYDDRLGTFLQLPWKDSTGFVFSLYSYSLLSYEAVRLSYFSQLYERTADPEFKHWVEKLRDLFVDPQMYVESDKGLFWHNMTHFDGERLKGYSYMDVGFAGYPGGQGLISRSLMEYMEREENENTEDMEHLVKKNLDFIVNTQNDDGSWNAAIPFKRFNPSSMMTEWSSCEGATAENARSLMRGFKYYGDENYKESALKALTNLKRENPICKNVLRDIGREEPEGYSAILALNAFLEAYQHFGDEEYLRYANVYAHHLLTYHYWYGDIIGHFHPITESITPRLSPFESLMAVKAYRRMGDTVGDGLWNRISDMLLNRTLELVDDNGGLSEGVFVRYSGELESLVMEQTFATAELLHTISNYDYYTYQPVERAEMKIEDTGQKFIVEDFLEINKDHLEIVDKKRGYSLDIQMSNPYTFSSRSKTFLLNRWRKLGLAAGVLDLKYVVKGVYQPEEKVVLQSLKKFVTDYRVESGDKRVIVEANLPYHRISIEVYKADSDVFMDLSMEVKVHDLKCNKVTISFDEVYEETLKTNWTHGGVYKRSFLLGPRS